MFKLKSQIPLFAVHFRVLIEFLTKFWVSHNFYNLKLMKQVFSKFLNLLFSIFIYLKIITIVYLQMKTFLFIIFFFFFEFFSCQTAKSFSSVLFQRFVDQSIEHIAVQPKCYEKYRKNCATGARLNVIKMGSNMIINVNGVFS